MKKILKIAFVLVVIFVLGMIAFRIFFGAARSAGSVLVSEKVSRTTIRTTISSTGTLSPMDTVNVGTQVSGDIAKIYVDFNSKVKKGQVIAELDPSKLKATLYQAQISASSAQTDYEHKLSVYERTKKLAESNSASAVDLETAEYEMKSAKLSWESRKSEVDQAKLNLSYCVIKSPIDGVVLERSVDVGQTVAASMSTPTLFVLAKDLSKMRVMADVDEADIGAVKTGQNVSFTVDAFQDETFSGKVESVRLNPTVTSNVVTYTVVISAENLDLKLLPGMTATCTIVTQEVENALSVSAAAIKYSPSENVEMLDPRNAPKGIRPPPRKDDDDDFGPPPPGFGGPSAGGAHKKASSSSPKLSGKNVWISVDGKVAFRPVRTGISDGVNVEILAGLADGDSVIVREEETAAAVTATDSGSGDSPFMPGPKRKKK